MHIGHCCTSVVPNRTVKKAVHVNGQDRHANNEHNPSKAQQMQRSDHGPQKLARLRSCLIIRRYPPSSRSSTTSSGRLACLLRLASNASFGFGDTKLMNVSDILALSKLVAVGRPSKCPAETLDMTSLSSRLDLQAQTRRWVVTLRYTPTYVPCYLANSRPLPL